MMLSIFRHAREPLVAIGVYTMLYVALDRISMVQVLPGTDFTLWDPPPACSLALLLIKGLRYAPALFPAAILADSLNGEFAVGVLPTLVMEALVAVGYTAIATALRPYAAPATGFQGTRDVTWFLAITGTGVLGLAGVVGMALVLMHVLPWNGLLAAVQHFWIGDITGIVGLFPALMTMPFAWKRWQALPAHSRLVDPVIFGFALAAALWIVFGAATARELQFFYLLLLPVIWIGMRHGLPWCTLAILTEQLALIAVMTLHGYRRSDFTGFQILSLTIAVTGVVLAAVVTERQRAELHLRQQQMELGRMARLTTAGALGSAIVHEISQPLATIAAYAHACRLLLRAGPQEHGSLTETLEKVESEALRAGEIVERLRNFLANGEVQLTPWNLGEVVRGVVAALADEARSRGVEVHIETQSIVPVTVDRLQMEQVLLNLIRNGIEAAAENGIREKWVEVRLHGTGGELQVEVEDNGPGVPPEIAEHLFEPFATGKPRGLGLGLLLSRQIIRSHGGDLWHDRAIATGARFAFRLPGSGSGADVR